MKQCPKCSRVYADEALNFCLDDGEWLTPLESSLDAPTAIISGEELSSERPAKIEELPKTRTLDNPGTNTRRNTKVIIIAAAALLLIGLTAAAAYKFNFLGKRSIAVFQPGKIDRLTGTGDVRNAAISPDGKFVVYLKDEPGQQSLWIIDVATKSTLQLIPPAPTEYTGLNFSPDGNYVYFSCRDGKSSVSNLFSVAKLGGSPKPLGSNVDSSVTFSPDGKQIAFIRMSDGGSLVISNADGTNEYKLASFTDTDQTADEPPAWSPDGNVIAVSVDHHKENKFYAMVVGFRVSDGSMQPLADHHWNATFGKMAWSSDGSTLFVAARDESQTFSDTQIWQVSYPGGDSKKITDSLNSYSVAAISNDGRSFVTVTHDALASLWLAPIGNGPPRQLSSTPGTKDGYCGVAWTNDNKIIFGAKQVALTDLWIMDLNGGNKRQLTDSPDVERFPSVSRENRSILFDEIQTNNTDIWISDMDGKNLRQLTHGVYDTVPDISPDGKWFVYRDDNSQLERQELDSAGPVKINNKQIYAPAISPDGNSIACYYRPSTNEPYKLAIIPASGGEPVKLFDIAPAMNTPTGLANVRNWLVLRWRPDSKSIFYVYDSNGSSNIWEQSLNGSAPKQVTDFKTDLIWTFDISPDGKNFVMSRGRNIDDVIMISNGNAQ